MKYLLLSLSLWSFLFNHQEITSSAPEFLSKTQVDSAEVHFFKGKWAELKSKAAAEKKPFFVDMYAEWCGPCKLMTRFTFKDSGVAEVANSKFMAFKIDAEGEEGLELAKMYKVRDFPTVLFFNQEGELMGREVGYYDAEQFLYTLEKYLKKHAKKFKK